MITHRCNNKPFPIRECAAVVQVSDDDPRGKKPGTNRKKSLTFIFEVALRGGKKVIATRNLAAYQVIGIYEGRYMFDAESHLTVLTRLEYENKLMETCSLDFDHLVSKEALDAAKIPIYKEKGEEGAFYDKDKCYLSSALVVNGEYDKGYFQWCAEVNGIY